MDQGSSNTITGDVQNTEDTKDLVNEVDSSIFIAAHYAASTACREMSEQTGKLVTKEFVYGVAEAAVHILRTLAMDSEAFAHHRGSMEIEVADVALVSRRNEALQQEIRSIVEGLNATPKHGQGSSMTDRQEPAG